MGSDDLRSRDTEAAGCFALALVAIVLALGAAYLGWHHVTDLIRTRRG